MLIAKGVLLRGRRVALNGALTRAARDSRAGCRNVCRGSRGICSIRRVLSGVFLVLCLLAASFGLAQAQAQAPQSSAVVKIWVRKLGSGNLEFGLWDVNSETSMAGLTKRYFPYEEADPGEWRYSNEIRIGDSSNSPALVMVQARKLVSGNVEFGLRVGPQVWVPRARFFLYAATEVSDGALYSSSFDTAGLGCANGIAVMNTQSHPVSDMFGLIQECKILLQFHDQLLGEGGTSLGWSTAVPMTSWRSRATGSSTPAIMFRDAPPSTHVDHIRADRTSMGGTISPKVADLTELITLSLTNLDLRGEIPSELGSLSKLTRLDLGGNDLTGGIPPSLTNLNDLESLVLYGNDLRGGLPGELGGLERLASIEIYENRSLGGTIPVELGSLADLSNLNLHSNGMTGEIPSALGGLTSLTDLILNNNELSGEIPPELGSLASLLTLRLDNNELSGEIPPELGGLTSLLTLRLDNNELGGEIPPELGGLTNLQHLYLNDNVNLIGSVPASLGGLANLERLYIDNTGLTGCIPASLNRDGLEVRKDADQSFCTS